jgi:hypothetical protein
MLFSFLKTKECIDCNTELVIGDNWTSARQSQGKYVCKSCWSKRDANRMYVNGKEISKNHPLHKPGRYKALDDAWSHQQIERTTQGEVYIIVNEAWKDWVKVGKAVSSSDRLNGYQTSSPFRDYKVVATLTTDNRHTKEKEMHKIFEHFAEERMGEWFKIDKVTAIKLFNYQVKENVDAA